MPLPIEMLFVGPRAFPLGTRRNHRYRSLSLNLGNEGITVIGFVTDDKLTREPFHQCRRLFDVTGLPGGEPETQGIAQAVGAQVQLGREPAPAAPQGLFAVRFPS